MILAIIAASNLYIIVGVWAFCLATLKTSVLEHPWVWESPDSSTHSRLRAWCCSWFCGRTRCSGIHTSTPPGHWAGYPGCVIPARPHCLTPALHCWRRPPSSPRTGSEKAREMSWSSWRTHSGRGRPPVFRWGEGSWEQWTRTTFPRHLETRG